jgi:hypothetical protein
MQQRKDKKRTVDYSRKSIRHSLRRLKLSPFVTRLELWVPGFAC